MDDAIPTSDLHTWAVEDLLMKNTAAEIFPVACWANVGKLGG